MVKVRKEIYLCLDLYLEYKKRKHLQPAFVPLMPTQQGLKGVIKSVENPGIVATFGSLSNIKCCAIMVTRYSGNADG